MAEKTALRVALRDPQTGQVVVGPTGRPLVEKMAIAPVKPYIKNFWLTPNPIPPLNTVYVDLAIGGTAGDTYTLDFEVDEGGHFEWKSIIGTSQYPFYLRFYDPGTRRYLQSSPVRSENIVPTAQRKFLLPDGYFLNVGEGKRVIQCEVRNASTAFTNRVYLVLEGRRFYHKEAPQNVIAKFMRQFVDAEKTFPYFLQPAQVDTNSGDILQIGIGGAIDYLIRSDPDFDTIIRKSMLVTDPANATLNWQIMDRASSRLLSNGILDRRHGWGTSEFPFLYSDPYLLERNKDLILTVTNTTAAPIKAWFTLACLRVLVDPFI